MKYKILFSTIALFSLFFIAKFHSNEIKNYFIDEKVLTIKDQNNKHVGSIIYFKIPFLKQYILYDFFIKPEFRSKGYGAQLLRQAIDELIDKNRATKIFIQPGPFDIDKNGSSVICDKSEYEKKLFLLIKLYHKFGFEFVKDWISSVAKFGYWIAGIVEDPKYLMVIEN